MAYLQGPFLEAGASRECDVPGSDRGVDCDGQVFCRRGADER